MSNRTINSPIKQIEQIEQIKLINQIELIDQFDQTKQINQLEADKRRIEHVIYRLENQLQRLQIEIDPDIDEADPGLTSQVITHALLKNARQKAEAIKRALTQAASGSYGICEDCQQPIDQERLEIFPQATRCVVCKAAQENLVRRPSYRVA